MNPMFMGAINVIRLDLLHPSEEPGSSKMEIVEMIKKGRIYVRKEDLYE